MNYFELFDIPVSLKIDKASLSKKYFDLQKKYHPDFYTQSTDDEKSEALEKSSLINKALKTLQNEDETLKYVLQQKKLLEEEEKYALPPDFLMEMLELNEAVMEEEPAIITKKIAAVEDELYSAVEAIINNYKEGITTDKELLEVKEYYYKKKYLQRILDRIDG
ncbi:MAG TPA: Fe-S protein assembly co-chaperone HscB [Ferruginibacter sp.]|jgi:molecular chaperone HscB|nr:Fe-S protein assembly co-chaperone HscB [Ferruginibacter sp.]